ncbi:MAG: hypothetical protein H0W71_01675 [Sphingomonas sp.]|nr:hypothetical protein [Sphingomonas sp.]
MIDPKSVKPQVSGRIGIFELQNDLEHVAMADEVGSGIGLRIFKAVTDPA